MITVYVFFFRTYTPPGLTSRPLITLFLEPISFPTLAAVARVRLDADITLEEVQLAMGWLKGGKAPGTDGLPSEFYSNFMELLASKLTSLFSDYGSLEELPDTMNEAMIVLVHKHGKDPQDCAAYRPISLLNVYAKIFAKVLANWLSLVIEDLVDVDQTGFMPEKGTNINVTTIFRALIVMGTDKFRVIASLDAGKAFDSVEWSYLWEVIQRFRVGPKFKHRIKLLYSAPRTRVHTNNWLSAPFSLLCGTRQRCLLSPSLFALALEPLAILLRSAPDVMGLWLGKLEERLSLYADDTLLYLNDAGPSLLATLRIFDNFGNFFRVLK